MRLLIIFFLFCFTVSGQSVINSYRYDAGGGSFTTEYQAILDEATTQGYTLPSAGDQTTQNQIIADLKTAGAWSRIDVMYYFKGSGDSDFKKLDWKNPTTRSALTVANGGSLTWASTGVTGDGSAYLESNYAPDTDAVNLTLADACIFIEVVAVSSTNGSYVGTMSSNTNYIWNSARGTSGMNMSSSPLPPLFDFTGVTGILSTHTYNDGSDQISAYNGSTEITNSPSARSPNSLYGEQGIFRVNNDSDSGEIGFVIWGASMDDIITDTVNALN